MPRQVVMHVDLPKRQSVVEQVATYIRAKIAAGHWEEKLPALRSLHSQLQVSRNTLHRALVQLEHEGLVKLKDRSRTLVCQSVSALPVTNQDLKVGWLEDAPLNHLSGIRLREILHLQVSLRDHGMSFELFLNQSTGDRYSANRLRLWMEDRKVTIWVLANVSARVQQFFAASGTPAVVLGTRVPKLDLPSVDLCARATCRHAVGQFARLGHKRIGLLLPKRLTFDDSERKLGFEEGLASHEDRMTGAVFQHDGTPVGIGSCLDWALSVKPSRLTGLIASRSMECVCAMSFIGCARGIRVPAEVSVLSLENDLCFPNMIPSVAHYEFERNAIFRKLFRIVSHEDPGSYKHDVELDPKFVSGETLAAPPELAK